MIAGTKLIKSYRNNLHQKYTRKGNATMMCLSIGTVLYCNQLEELEHSKFLIILIGSGTFIK